MLNLIEMAKNKLPFVEDAFIHRSTMFSGINYQLWKIRMKILIESNYQGIWDGIVNGPYTLKCVVENKQVDKP